MISHRENSTKVISVNVQHPRSTRQAKPSSFWPRVRSEYPLRPELMMNGLLQEEALKGDLFKQTPKILSLFSVCWMGREQPGLVFMFKAHHTTLTALEYLGL